MKKIIFTTLLISVFLIVFQVAFAGTIIQNYPDIPGAKKPGEGDPGQELPQLIQYIFRFSLGLVGIVGILALIFAAFGYLTSVGDPAKAASAKQRIVSALLGVLLLLSSYILLKVINPDLLKLKVEGKPVNIDQSPGECRPVWVKWEKAEINAGESVYLVYKLNKYCKEDAEIVQCDVQGSYLRQDRPKGTGCESDGGTGWDPYCQNVYYTGRFNRAHDKDGSILLKYLYTFEGQCKDKWGFSECPKLPVPPGCLLGFKYTGIICNFKIGQPEVFYISPEEKCIMNTGEEFSLSNRLSITVKDGK